MKLLLDQGEPRSAAAILREAGFDAVHTGDIGLAEATDSDILHHASLEGRVIVTLDADFHMLLALSQATTPSVIRVRIEGLRAEEFSRLIHTVLEKCSDDLKTGAMVSVSDRQIRIRHMPV
jgi:predicted nuclease of predicted toxin-antitoxin system